MTYPHLLQKKNIILGIVWLLIYYITGVISKNLSATGGIISVVWFPAGVATTAFLCNRKRYWLPLLVGFIIITMTFYGVHKDQILSSFVYSILSMPSYLIIAWIVQRYARREDMLQIILLWLSTILAVSFFDAFFSSILVYWMFGLPIFNNFLEIFVSDTTGIIFATTVIMGFINIRLPAINLFKKNFYSGVLVLIILCLSSVLIFNDSALELYKNYFSHYRNLARLSLVCIPILLAVILSILWGNRGGAIALLILAIISIYYTKEGLGPFYLKGLYQQEHLLMIQGYLTATALLILFLSVLTRSSYQFYNNKKNYLKKHPIYQLNISDETIEWINMEEAWIGVNSTMLSNIALIMQRVHPDDRERLQQHWQFSYQQSVLPDITFRLMDDNGEWRTIKDQGSLFFGENSSGIVIGNWHLDDVIS